MRLRYRSEGYWARTVVLLAGALPFVAVALSVALSVALLADASLLTRAWPSVDPTAISHAAVVPTVTLMISVTFVSAFLVQSFFIVSSVATSLRRIAANALAWSSTVARDAVLAAAAAGDDVRTQAQARAYSDAVLAELAVLRSVIAMALDESPALRYLGVFRPGAASLGGLAAAFVTAITLGVRIATLAVAAQTPPAGR